MRAVIYARVSSLAQRDRHTIASQLSTLPPWIASQGWTLAAPPKTYVDDGRTAKAGHLDDRPAFARLLADAAGKCFEVVCVVDLDRLTRSEDLVERGQVLGAFQRAGVQLAISSTGQVLDLSTSGGDLLASLSAFFAAEENRKRRERTVRGKLEAIGKGRKPAGPTPYGYRYDRSTHVWSVDPEAAPIVVEIFRRLTDGDSLAQVADDLHLRGVARPRSGRWSRERVYSIARSRTYLGEWTADRRRGLSIVVPRLISDEQYAAAHAALASGGPGRGRARSRHCYLLEGIATCAVCGARLRIASATQVKGGRRAAYYICARRYAPRLDEPRCSAGYRAVADIDARVWDAAVSELSRPGYLEAAIDARLADAEEGRQWADDLRQAETGLRRLGRHEAGILERSRRGLVSERALTSELAATARERLVLERQAAAARRASQSVAGLGDAAEALRGQLATLRERLPRATPSDRRDLLRLLRARVVVGEDSLELAFEVATGPSSAISPCTDPACRMQHSRDPHFAVQFRVFA